MAQGVNTKAEEIRTQLAPIIQRSISEYVRLDTLGTELSFQKGESLFEQMITFLRRLSDCRLDDVPDGVLNDILGRLQPFKQNVSSVLNFGASSVLPNDVPINFRDRALRDLQSSFEELYRSAAPIVALNDKSLATLSSDLSDAQQLIVALAAERDRAVNDAKSTQEKIDEILTSAQEAAGKIGVSKNAAFFAAEVTKNENASKRWLGATTVLALITLFFSLGVWPFSLGIFSSLAAPVNGNSANVWQHIISRLVALSVLYYALVWSSRNYFALQHNVIVNRHRQNALSTFQTFVESATDPQTKNQVLVRATESIFSPEVSGYLTKEPDPRPSSQVLEIISNTMHR